MKILLLLSKREMCVCELESAFGLPQPTISYHLGVLVAIPNFWKLSAMVKAMRENPNQPPPPQFQKYRRLSRVGTVVAFIFLLGAALLMIASAFYPF